MGQLQERFNFISAFIDDPEIPSTTEVFYSKFHLTINILLVLLVVAISSVIEYLTIKHDGQTSFENSSCSYRRSTGLLDI